MKKNHLLVLLIGVLVLCSCTTPKNIVYFQDLNAVDNLAVQTEQSFRLRPEDKINIIVNSKDPSLEALFTLTSPNQRYTLGASSMPQTVAVKNGVTGQQPVAFTVDAGGNIYFPYLGEVHVAGMTRMEVAALIRQSLMNLSLVNDPVVTVEYVNMAISVLGEVKNAGRMDIYKDHFTILDAIAQAGDLTINGQRENVMVIRQENGSQHTYFIDLCSNKSVVESPAYYLRQNDVVYVSPNTRRQRDANASGNTIFTPSFWISAASLLTTITALLIK